MSKINQIVSLFVTALWLPMIGRAVGPLSPAVAVDWFELAVLGVATAACVAILIFGRTDSINYSFLVTQRTSHIVGGEPHPE